MLKENRKDWMGKRIIKEMKSGALKFDFLIQRNYVWKPEKQSYFIHTLMEGYPVAPLYFSGSKKHDNFRVIDGKQRCTTIKRFIENEFALHADTPMVTLEDKTEYEVAGKTFDELPEELQDNITGFPFIIYSYLDLTPAQECETFFRLNNGQSFTRVELTRPRMKSLETFIEVSKHNLIEDALTANMKKAYENEKCIWQIYTLLFLENRNFSGGGLGYTLIDIDVTKEQVDIMNKAMDGVKYVIGSLDNEDKQDKKLIKRLQTRTHMVMATYLSYKCIENNFDKDILKKLLEKFFDPKSLKVSINPKYNDSCSAGSASQKHVTTRVKCMDGLIDFAKNESKIKEAV